MMFRTHRHESPSREINNELGTVFQLFLGFGEKQDGRDRLGMFGGFGTGKKHLADDGESWSVKVGEESELQRGALCYLAFLDNAHDRVNRLTYGLLVFSHVTRSISTVHKDLNRRSCGDREKLIVSFCSVGIVWYYRSTCLFIRFSRPDHVIPSEQHAADIP